MRTLLILCAVSAAASCIAAESQRKRLTKTQVYFTFAINCHDFVNSEQSAQTLKRLVGIFDKYGVKGDFYLNDPLVRAYREKQPAIIEILKKSGHTMSYHLRPPHPVCFPSEISRELSKLGREELIAELREYETRGWDPTTGKPNPEGIGGYALVKETFGVAPCSTGLNALTPQLRAAELKVLRDLGAKMSVFHHEGGSDPINPLVWRNGVLVRPSDFAIARLGKGPRASDFWWNHVRSGNAPADPVLLLKMELVRLHPDRIYFAQSLIHENNFYSENTSWGPIYYSDRRKGRPKQPPFDLNTTAPWVRTRSKADQEAIWKAYERMVAFVAKNRQIKVVTSRDIVAMVEPEERVTPNAVPARLKPVAEITWPQQPTRKVNWLRDASFENKDDSAYRIGISPGKPRPQLSWETADVHSGQVALKLEGTQDASCVLLQDVNIDKGRIYRIGGWLRGTGVGAASFELRLFEGPRPMGQPPGLKTETVSGDFGWRRVETHVLVNQNFRKADFALVWRGGTLRVDDLFVESEEPAAVPIPEQPRGVLLVGFLVHSENVEAFVKNKGYFRAKTQVLEDLAKIFRRHGAKMTIQPELELALGAEKFDPDFFRRLHTKYGVEFSVHTHGPKGVNPSIEDVLRYASERKKTFERMGAGEITDLNGNFDVEDWSVFARAGFRSMTAFKNKYTQRQYGGFYIHPWRPSPSSPLVDEVSWSEDNPNSKVVFLPGQGGRVTKFHERLKDVVYPPLTQALAACEPSKVNTWYFMSHVDKFVSHEHRRLDEYMRSDEYQKALASYDSLLTEVFDPLVKRDYIKWATPSEMRRAFEASLEHGGGK